MDPLKDTPKDDERNSASGTLRRLVCFLASALDVRYAFVSARSGPAVAEGRLALWLARDYGLRSDFAEIDLGSLAPAAPRGVDLGLALRLAWPHEPDLRGGETVGLDLLGAGGRPVGHLGLLDTEGRGRLSALEHLRPLARTAAAELERWAQLQLEV
jgi:hypothetical protein